MANKKAGITAEGRLKAKKSDTTENGVFDIQELKERDKNKVMLRINKSMVILVSPINNNQEYAERYRNRLNRVKFEE